MSIEGVYEDVRACARGWPRDSGPAAEQEEPEFLKVNPSGKMPALKLPGGEVNTESGAILLTVADRHPDAGLLPPHASFARAECYRWIVFLASEVYPMVEISDYPHRFV